LSVGRGRKSVQRQVSDGESQRLVISQRITTSLGQDLSHVDSLGKV
jgi:hypothetical protein